jgi:hypothetical protein
MSEIMQEVCDNPDAVALPRRSRRLADKIMTAFHQACDVDDIETAAALVKVLELLSRRPSPVAGALTRADMTSLVFAHERLWSIRHPQHRR